MIKRVLFLGLFKIVQLRTYVVAICEAISETRKTKIAEAEEIFQVDAHSASHNPLRAGIDFRDVETLHHRRWTGCASFAYFSAKFSGLPV
jgi:hypothetical protein